MSETTHIGLRQYGNLIIAFNLPTQWRSKGGQVRTRASGRSPWAHQHT